MALVLVGTMLAPAATLGQSPGPEPGAPPLPTGGDGPHVLCVSVFMDAEPDAATLSPAQFVAGILTSTIAIVAVRTDCSAPEPSLVPQSSPVAVEALSLTQLKEIAGKIGYKTLSRHPDRYAGELLYYRRARVLEAKDLDGGGQLVLVATRRNRAGEWVDDVAIRWLRDRPHVGAGDTVEFVMQAAGNQRFETGARSAVPSGKALRLRLRK